MALGNYIKETRAEMRHVNWPSREMTINFTLIVLGIAIATGIFLGFFDVLFTYLLQVLITR